VTEKSFLAMYGIVGQLYKEPLDGNKVGQWNSGARSKQR